jgi:hypothetical protein
MKTSDCFAELQSKKRHKKGSPVILCFMKEQVYVEEKVDSWKVQLTDGTEGWIESDAIREVK